jgi:uncharacterized protein YjbJ (UPF0337 family)
MASENRGGIQEDKHDRALREGALRDDEDKHNRLEGEPVSKSTAVKDEIVGGMKAAAGKVFCSDSLKEKGHEQRERGHMEKAIADIPEHRADKGDDHTSLKGLSGDQFGASHPAPRYQRLDATDPLHPNQPLQTTQLHSNPGIVGDVPQTNAPIHTTPLQQMSAPVPEVERSPRQTTQIN